jgi:hypothetical protein
MCLLGMLYANKQNKLADSLNQLQEREREMKHKIPYNFFVKFFSFTFTLSRHF